jgi:hypothetical protein
LNTCRKTRQGINRCEQWLIAKKRQGITLVVQLKLPESKGVLWVAVAVLVLRNRGGILFPDAGREVATVRRGTGHFRRLWDGAIEPAFVVHVRAQNSGFIQLAEPFSAGRGAIGKSVEERAIADDDCRRDNRPATQASSGGFGCRHKTC